jgi:predicted N-acyltransferase
MEVVVKEHIGEIDSAAWDILAGDNVLASHRWLEVIEQSTNEAVDFTYILVRDKGKAIGAAAAQRHYRPARAESLDHLYYGRAARIARSLGVGVAPALVVGSRFGISQPFLVDASLPHDVQAGTVDLLVESILDVAGRARASVMIRNVPAGVHTSALKARKFSSGPEVPTTYLDTHWTTFAQYRAALRKVHPSTESALRQQNNRAQRLGVTLERIVDPEMVTDEMYALIDRHFFRLNHLPAPVNSSFLRNALRMLGDEADLVVARDAEHLLGVNFVLRSGGIARSMMVGVDPDFGRESSVYFVLMNKRIERTIECRDRRLYFGKLVYDVKLRRGCSLAHSTIWLRGQSGFRRGLLSGFNRLRTKTVERSIREFVDMSDANAAVLGAPST